MVLTLFASLQGDRGLGIYRRSKHPREECSDGSPGPCGQSTGLSETGNSRRGVEGGASATGPVVHGKTPVNGLPISADHENGQDLDTSAQDPGACRSSMGSNIADLSAGQLRYRYDVSIRRS